MRNTKYINTIRYYAVTTKCGHVGRNKYIKITFAVIAESKKEAAKKAKYIPRVKHDHKDAILNIKEITYNEFLELLNENDNNEYLHCKNIQEQRNIFSSIESKIYDDDHNNIIIYSTTSRDERLLYNKRKLKSLLYSYKYDNKKCRLDLA